MMKIYHNNRCRKSREALQYLENKGTDIQIIKYMKDPLTATEWKDLFLQIGKSPQEMIRTQEPLWKNVYKDQEIDDVKLLDISLLKFINLLVSPPIADETTATLFFFFL